MATTINLLPPQFKRLERLDRAAPLVQKWLLVALIALVAVWGINRAAEAAIHEQSDRLSTQIADKEAAAEYDELSRQVKSLANLAEEYQRVFAKNRVWEEVFTYLEQTLPAGTQIETLAAAPDRQNYLLIVTGSAADHRSVGLFRENLLSYRSQPDQPERVSQVVIDSISTSAVTGRQQFSLRLTFDLNPKSEAKK